MKYMTKKWYETMQKTNLHILLKVSKNAEIFSDEYFRKLYKKREKEWLISQEELSKMTFEDAFPKLVDISETPLTLDEYEKEKKLYLEIKEKQRLIYVNDFIFDIELEKKNFRNTWKQNIKYLNRVLPNHILNDIADIRVLALRYASAKVKNEIKIFSNENEKVVNSTMKLYLKEYNKSFNKNEPNFIKDFNFHDCNVTSCIKKGNHLILKVDNSHGFTKKNKIILKNYNIIKQDKMLHGSWWLNDEIYKIDGGFEIHVLLQKKDLIDFIVSVADIVLY